MTADQLFETDDLWPLMEAVASELNSRREAHAVTDKTFEAARKVNGEAYNRLSDAVTVWRDLARAVTGNAGYDGKFDPVAAIQNARAFVESEEKP